MKIKYEWKELREYKNHQKHAHNKTDYVFCN